MHRAFAFGRSRASGAVDIVIVSIDKSSKLATVIKDVAVSSRVITEALFVCRVSHGFLKNRGRDRHRGSYSYKAVIDVRVVFRVVSILLVYGAGASASSDIGSRGRGSLGGVLHYALSPLAV